VDCCQQVLVKGVCSKTLPPNSTLCRLLEVS
jgi:hypothetical protein